ncbi:MAG TPA: fumarylacetoacetate hydrolase family protein [Candidatus Dormibacteraeota bacterium]|nr:fumarylacetoacetate hydrolase family protein [Candidatus Dormibacteraeota bacterium]
MKLCRFQVTGSNEQKVCTGVLDGNTVHEVSSEWPIAGSRTGRQWALDQVHLVTPVAPSKIVCVGRNYKMHVAEMGKTLPTDPLIFFKPLSSLIAPGETIELPPDLGRIDYEGELGVVIGRRCSQLGPDEDVAPYLLGFTCVNDVSARELQKKDGLFARAKGFDTFCPLGPVIETELDWKQARVQTRLNGELKQNGAVSDMIFPVDMLVRFISQVMTLLPGDVIATGTPEGVSPLKAGDVVEVSIEGIGKLRNPVAARGAR